MEAQAYRAAPIENYFGVEHMTPPTVAEQLWGLARMSGQEKVDVPANPARREMLMLKLVQEALNHGVTWAQIGTVLVGRPDGKLAKREAKHAEDFFKADAVLMQADRGVSTAVRRLCEDNETPGGFAELARVRTGLMHLVSHWNLTGTEKRDSRRNAR